MQIYEVQSPDGQIYEIEGNSPPNAQQLKQIFASIQPAGQSQLPPAPVVPESSNVQSVMQPGQDIALPGIPELGQPVMQQGVLDRSESGKPVVLGGVEKNVGRVEDFGRSLRSGLTTIGRFGANFSNEQLRPLLGKEPLSEDKLNEVLGLLGGAKHDPQYFTGHVGHFAGDVLPYMAGLGAVNLAKAPALVNQLLTGATQGGIAGLTMGGTTGDAAWGAGLGAALPPVLNKTVGTVYNIGKKAAKGIPTGIIEASGLGKDSFKRILESNVDLLNQSDFFASPENLNRIATNLRGAVDRVKSKELAQFTKSKKALFDKNKPQSLSGIGENIIDSPVVSSGEKEIAYDVISQATGKSKRWLKSQLEAKNKQLSTQKRTDTIQDLIENSEDSIEQMMPEWNNVFGHRDLSNLNAGQELAKDAFNVVMGKNYKPFREMDLSSIDKQYAQIINKFKTNKGKAGQEQAEKEFFEKIYNEIPDDARKWYMENFYNDLFGIQNIKEIPSSSLFKNARQQLEAARQSGKETATKGMGGNVSKQLKEIINTYSKKENLTLDDLQFLKANELDAIINYKPGIGQSLTQGERDVQRIARNLRKRTSRALQKQLGSEYKQMNQRVELMNQLLGDADLKPLLSGESVDKTASGLRTMLGNARGERATQVKKVEQLVKNLLGEDINITDDIMDYLAASDIERRVDTGKLWGFTNLVKRAAVQPLTEEVIKPIYRSPLFKPVTGTARLGVKGLETLAPYSIKPYVLPQYNQK